MGAAETRLPDGVTYATTGTQATGNPNSDGMSMGTAGNPNAGGLDPNGGTAGSSTGGNPNTGNPNTGNPNTGNPNGGTGTTPPVAIPGMTLTARLNPARCVDILQGKTAPGSAIDLYDCNGSGASQLWQLVHGQLRASGNRCLDLPAAAAVGTPLIINPCDDALPANQQWTLEAGALKSNAVSPAFCVALHFGGTDNGTVLELATCAGDNDAQHWGASNTNGTDVKGITLVSGAASDHCLVAGANGTPTWDVCTAASASAWTLDGSSQGTALKNGASCLAAHGTGLFLEGCNGGAPQAFSVSQGQVRTADGSVCVSAKPAAGQASVAASLLPCDGADAGQQWSLGGLGQP